MGNNIPLIKGQKKCTSRAKRVAKAPSRNLQWEAFSTEWREKKLVGVLIDWIKKMG